MKRWSIATRTRLLGMVPAMSLFVLLSAYFIGTRLASFDEQLQRRGELISAQLAPMMEYGVLVGDSVYLQNMARSVLREADVVYVRVENNAGVVMLNERRNNAPPRAEVFDFTTDIISSSVRLQQNDDPLASTMVDNESRVLGRVTVALTNEPFLQQRNEFMLASLGLVVLALSIAYAAARWIARSITEPIRSLSQAVQQIKNGAYNTRVLQQYSGEMGSLEADINALASSLASAQENERMYTQGLERARAAAETASRAKSQFLANMSHELRTPMNGTLGMLQLLRETGLNKQQSEYINTACESTEHLLRVVNDILDFSKIEDGKLTLESVWFNAATLIERALQSFQNEARLKGIDLRSELVGDLQQAEVMGDPTRLRQILVNLIGNAVKFTEHGSVKVRAIFDAVTDQQLRLQVHVEDTGMGIAENKQHLIFDAFTQADGSTTRRHGGTGLGLSICRQLIGLMNGDIRVKSTPGVGSIFTIQLQLRFRQQAETSAFIPAPNTSQPQLSGTVLLVEDNMVNQAVTQGLMQLLGLRVETANDGLQALAYSQHREFDAVVLDCQMPNLDGFETARRWRQRETELHRRRTPIIALTANAMEGDRDRCLAAGMDDYLSKPVGKDTLAQCLQKWLAVDSDSAGS